MTDKGTVIRRNRRHLLLTKESFEETENSDTDSFLSANENVEELIGDNENEVVNEEDNDNADIEVGNAADQVIQPNNNPSITTRYGRTVRRPGYLDIYE